jgi:hypothetical protein
MRGIVGLVVWATALLAAGCAERAYEVGVRVSDKQDTEVRFFAYTTRLPPVNPEDVLLVAASVDSLEGRIDLELPERVSVYPTFMETELPRHVLHPRALLELAPELLRPSLPERPGHRFVIGFFTHNVTYLPQWQPWPAQSAVKSIQWAALSEKQAEKLRQDLITLRADAAAYGAQAVVDICAFETFSRDRRAANPNALRLWGQAIVFDHTESAPRAPTRPAWMPDPASER